MAKDGVKRGFFFYLGLFLLILLGIASVLMLVMMFMPKTNILGIQYFTNSSVIRVDKTTDESKTSIDFDHGYNFSSVAITTDFAKVSVQKNNEFDRNGIYFVNRSRGFVSSKKANDFSYSVTIEDGILKISVEEEKAFLYFSKEVEVVFQIANETVNPLANKTVSVYTSSGDVNIGGGYAAGESHTILMNALVVETKSGNVNLSNYSTNNFSDISIKTRSGDISFSHPSIAATSSMWLETTSGDITATKLECPIVYFTAKKGKITVSEISGSADFGIVDNYVKIGTITGSASFSRSAGKLDSADINIKLINGNLTATEAGNADFNIKTVRGKAQIETNSGNINVSDNVFSNWILKTNTGKISATINTNADGVLISTEKGFLSLTLHSGFSNIVIANKEGKTNLTLPEKGKYKITFKYYDSSDDFDLSKFNFKKVKINSDAELKNPFTINNGGSGESTLTLKCSGEVNFAWN